MRKILTILVALVALAAIPAVASADVPSTITPDVSTNQMDLGQSCTTPWANGSYGAFGAAGFYVDGCTARITCPRDATHGCNVYGWGNIADWNGASDTMNARLRTFTYTGAVDKFWDTSCPAQAGG